MRTKEWIEEKELQEDFFNVMRTQPDERLERKASLHRAQNTRKDEKASRAPVSRGGRLHSSHADGKRGGKERANHSDAVFETDRRCL